MLPTEFWGLATNKHRHTANDIFKKLYEWNNNQINKLESQRKFMNQFEFISETSILRHDIKGCG